MMPDMDAPRDLMLIDQARQWLAEAVSISEVKDLRDRARAFEQYLKRRKDAGEAACKAEVLRVRADRRLGELLAETEFDNGGRPSKTGSTLEPVSPHLRDFGISRSESHRLQTQARVPEERFEAYIAQEMVRGPEADLSSRTFYQMGRDGERAERHAAMASASAGALPTGPFQVILADPPWEYEFSETANRDLANQCPTMTHEALCCLPVADLAADDAVLFLWTTNPKLEEAFDVLRAWGFVYRTSIVWVKDRPGMGYWVRGQHELVLIARCGDFPPPVEADRPPSVIMAPRGRHSAKPAAVHELIERAYPRASKVELFARQVRPAGQAGEISYPDDRRDAGGRWKERRADSLRTRQQDPGF